MSEIATQLEQIKLNPTLITRFLNESFDQCYQNYLDFIESQKDKKLKINQTLAEDYFEDEYFELCRIFIFGQIEFEGIISYIKSRAENKGLVCSKPIEIGDTVWSCQDCTLHPTCIICQECFENSDHKGHKISMSRDVEGCCDCGDHESWKVSGFCTNHQGYTENNISKLIGIMPIQMQISSQEVFNHITKQLKSQLFMYVDETTKRKKHSALFTEFFLFIEWSIDLSPVFTSFWEKSFENLNNYDKKMFNKSSGHQCSIQPDSVDESDFNENQEKQCTCTVFDLLLTRDFDKDEEKEEIIEKILMKLMQSSRIKQLLANSYIANYEALVQGVIENADNSLVQLNTQILTVDEITLNIFKSENLRNELLRVLNAQIDYLVDESDEQIDNSVVMIILDDLRLMSLPKTVKYIANETCFLESVLEAFSKFYQKNPILYQTDHVENEDEVINVNLEDTDIEMIKILKIYFTAINPYNTIRNSQIFGKFMNLLFIINKTCDYDPAIGHYIIPLHRAFGFYFTRLIMLNHLNSQQEIQDQSLFKQNSIRLIQWFHQLENQNILPQDHLQKAIEMVLRPVNKTLKFLIDIKSGKWIMSGEGIQDLYDDLYEFRTNYLYQYLGLYQTLIAISPQPEQTLLQIFTAFDIDNSLLLIDKVYVQQDESLVDESVNDNKFRSCLHLFLDFMIKLYTTEISLIYPMIYRYKRINRFNNEDISSSDDDFSESDYDSDSDSESDEDNHQEEYKEYLEEVKNSTDSIKEVKQMFRQDLKRELIHNFMLSQGKVNMKQLKKRSYNLYSNSRMFEKVLLEIADKTSAKKSQSMITFSLKEKYYKEYDPFYYHLNDNSHKAQENITHLKNERKHLNEIIGDYTYKYQTPVNLLVGQAFSQSTLLLCIIKIINLWCSKADVKLKLIDEQIGHDCLKLLIIVITCSQSLEESEKKKVTSVIKDNQSLLSKSLKHLMIKDEYMKKDILIIIDEIHKLDSTLKMSDEEEEKNNLIHQKDNKILEESKNDLKKEASRKKKEEIMKKFQSKRSNFIKAQQDSQIINTDQQNQEIQNLVEETKQVNQSEEANDVGKNQNEFQDHEIHCALCREILHQDNFYEEPFGQFAYISKSKLMYHTINQTIDSEKLKYCDYATQKKKEDEEWVEENEGYAKLRENNVKDLNLNYLHEQSFTGGTMTKCSHYSHQKCLNNYLKTCQEDDNMVQEKKILGLNSRTFQCPLCKSLANVLFPADDLSSFKGDIKEFLGNVTLAMFYKNLIALIIKNQNCLKGQVGAEVMLKLSLTLISMQKFIEHRIQLIDIRGLEDFMDGKQPGLKDYQRILMISKNMFQIQTRDEQKEGGVNNTICDEQMSSISQVIQDQQVFEQDISSLCLQALYYAFLKQQFNSISDHEQYLQTQKEIIAQFMKLIKLQSIAKLIIIQRKYKDVNFLNNNQKFILDCDMNMIYEMTTHQDAQQQLFISIQPFIKKIIAFVEMINSSQNKITLQDQLDLHNIYSQREQLLEIYGIDISYEFLKEHNKKQTSNQTILPCEQLFQFENQLLPQNCCNFLPQYLTGETLQLPNVMWLMTSDFIFNFIDLAPDFQSMILQFYKLKCKWCKTQPKSSVICLLCGELLCFIQDCCCQKDGMKNKEGEVTHHTRTCEGGQGIYLDTQDALVFMIEKKRSAERPSFYLNKYGESFSYKAKKYDKFYLDDNFGGISILENYKKMYMDFTMCNQIIKDRATKQNYYRAGRM